MRARAIGGAPKGERIRLFVAAAVPEDQRRALNAGIASVRDPAWGGRWTAPSAQHVTLKFLGWSSADRLEPLGAVLTQRDGCGEHHRDKRNRHHDRHPPEPSRHHGSPRKALKEVNPGAACTAMETSAPLSPTKAVLPSEHAGPSKVFV